MVGGEWVNILGGWGWVHCLIMPESTRKLMFNEDITMHLQGKWTFLKHLLGEIRIDSFGIGIEEAQLKMLLVKI